MAHTKAFKKINLNQQDFMNECVVAASFYFKILYTDVV